MRGLVFSLSIVLIGALLVSVVSIISYQNLEEQNEISRIAVFNRNQDEIAYLTREALEILKTYNVTLLVNGQTASIQQDMPFPSYTTFQGRMENLRNFSYTHSKFNLSFNPTDVKSTLPFTINNTAVYKRPNGINNNIITVTNASAVANYSVYVDWKGAGTINFVWSHVKSGNSNFTVTVKAGSATKADSRKLDLSQNTELDVKFVTTPGGPPGQPPPEVSTKVGFSIGSTTDTGFLQIQNVDNQKFALTVNTTLIGGSAELSFPKNIINTNSSLYNISRSATIKVI